VTAAVMLALLASLLLLAVGCSDAKTDPQADAALAMLNRWVEKVNDVEKVLADRVAAERRGDAEAVAQLEGEALAAMRPLEGFGKDARALFVDDFDTPVARVVVKAGDAFMEWAYVFRTDPPRGNLVKARRLADLATAARAAHRDALRALGLNPDDS
jgi:hypothetical protein